jgi:cytochrome o ubiquinol oxidase subunit IV
VKGFLAYFVGLGLAVLLTTASFVVAGTDVIYGPAFPTALAALAIAQIGIHLVFFLHVTTAPDNTNNVMTLAFGAFIVFSCRRRLDLDHGTPEWQDDASCGNGHAGDAVTAPERGVEGKAKRKGIPVAASACGVAASAH